MVTSTPSSTAPSIAEREASSLASLSASVFCAT